MGQSPPGETYNSTGTGVPLINGPEEFGPHYPTAIQWTTAPTKRCKQNDILFCVRGNTTGRMNIADREYCIGRGVASIRGFTGRSDTRFLRYLLDFRNRDLYKIARAGGSTFPNLGKSQLENLLVSIPLLLDEQRAIARMLDAVQKANGERQRELALERERKAALMEYLFTNGTRGEPTRHTDIGEMPESWQPRALTELGEIVTGTTPRTEVKEYYGGPFMFVAPGDIGESPHIKGTAKHLSEKGLTASRELPRDTVLTVCIGATIGKVAITATDRCATNQQINAVIPNGRIIPEFLYYALLFRSPELPSLASRTAIPIVNKSVFSQFSIPTTEIDEQAKIAKALAACDRKMDALVLETNALGELFRALLEDLMTGRLSASPLIGEHETQ